MKRWLISIEDPRIRYDIHTKEDVNLFLNKYLKKGDIVLIYNKTPGTCFSHLFTVNSSQKNEYHNSPQDLYQITLHRKSKLSPPLQLQELKSRNILDGWQTKFSTGAYEIPDPIWVRFQDLVLEKNPDLISQETTRKIKALHHYINCAVILDMIRKGIGDNSKCCLIPHNEAATESMFIIPILRYLGWNTMDPCEVNQEYGIGRKKVDYWLD
ncbi:hypothetical protein HYG87_02035 [Methanobacterium alkalithermotolerans]|uniref:Uncharacterized protein n=1 Tax=Methanobacterium alkalithermotolerans TaxID=2731220 RepID=A0A8T8K416_9EURY|nr:hypothetical protein [Methanobacterium alkalithermotolerans]QUH22632.1 hypothetical protein HYG87_02035 [Methanobacterium alkalithermotolerans]